MIAVESIRNVVFPRFFPMGAAGIEDAGYDGYKLVLITFTEKSIDSVD